MEFPEKISTRITVAIASQLNEFPEEKLEQINYGLAVFITNSYKLLILFIIAALLGVFRLFLAALFSFGLLRSFASGVHAKREWTCLPSSILLFSGIIYTGLNIKLNIPALCIIYSMCFAAVLRYAPADTEERPIVSLRLRKRLKTMSFAVLLIFFIYSLFSTAGPFSSIVAFSSLAECAMIIPITYRLTGSMYGTGIKIKEKMEVRK